MNSYFKNGVLVSILALFLITCRKDDRGVEPEVAEPDPLASYYGYWEVLSEAYEAYGIINGDTVPAGKLVGTFDLYNKYYAYIDKDLNVSYKYVDVAYGIPLVVATNTYPFTANDSTLIYEGMKNGSDVDTLRVQVYVEDDALVYHEVRSFDARGIHAEGVTVSRYRKLTDSAFQARLFDYLRLPATNNVEEFEGVTVNGETDIQRVVLDAGNYRTLTGNADAGTVTLRFFTNGGVEDKERAITYRVFYRAERKDKTLLRRVSDIESGDTTRFVTLDFSVSTVATSEQNRTLRFTEKQYTGEYGDERNVITLSSNFLKDE